ncbi:receptor-like protein 7 [Euphorbia lathyris]|uniref:receptor-like protein 7 n=1 Tax=Euphorbia lathyris TaxID=212925 RepID=UPI0033137DFD
MLSWKLGTDCCSWNGVTCNNISGHVTALDLSCSGLRGNLTSNSSLFHLPNLNNLNLAFNHFNRSNIPPEFGRFSSLLYLNLTTTWFSGLMPSEFSLLSKLVSLDLSLNSPLQLETSTLERIARNLTQVEEVFLDYVDMSLVPVSSLANFSSTLKYLSLVMCGLHGEFPETVLRSPNLLYLNLMLNTDLQGHLPKSNWSVPVQFLSLSSTGFAGELPNSIGNLKSLMVLDLDNCGFTGSIPVSFGNLEQLIRLDLSNNNWTGEIPNVFGNLRNLLHISFESSNFSGMLPSSIFNLTKLNWLDLSQNQFHGSIPIEACNLSSVVRFDLSDNLLIGLIPSCLYGLPKLVWFSLSSNKLTGQIGEFRSESLVEINLESNQIYGEIPESVFDLVNLTNFHVPSNNLSGVVDLKMFSRLKKLEELDLSNNQLSVITSNTSSISIWPQLYRFALSSCNVSEIPDFLKTQDLLGYFSLSHNKIHGEIPKWLFDLHYLEYIDLSHNFFTKVNELPRNLLGFLDLSFNLLQQSLPLPPPLMYMIFLSGNKFTGEISPLFCNVTTLQIIDLSNNSLSGTIPECFSNFSAELSVLNLGMNNLSGRIPGSFAEGNLLRNLNLNRNQLQGPLPQSLALCKLLEVLDLGNNKINDTFPKWLETLPKLQVLVLRNNSFHGYLGHPIQVSPLASLRIIDLSYNDFTGLLPATYFANFHSMMTAVEEKLRYMGEIYYKDSVVLTMKGQSIELVRILTIFTTIDLSSNRFEGQIPEVIGNLRSLIVLNFSHNSLTGRIPSSLGNLVNLESLDLSSNKVNGSIPEQMTSLTFLQVLNVSFNQLSGHIPQGKQFNTFENDSYIGNLGLCGFPLSKKCRNDVTPTPPPPSISDEDSESILDWKFAGLGYGCGMIFGLSVGYIMLSIGKPLWFIRLVYIAQQKMLSR